MRGGARSVREVAGAGVVTDGVAAETGRGTVGEPDGFVGICGTGRRSADFQMLGMRCALLLEPLPPDEAEDAAAIDCCQLDRTLVQPWSAPVVRKMMA